MPSAIDSPGRRLLVPPALLLGTVVAFVGCSLAGRLAAGCNLFDDIQRLHRAINAQTLYYPTASQVRALGRARLDRDKIAVVIGGNSVLYGAGQRTQELWTRHLQAELGDGYRVLNLALPGCCPGEFGGTAAEMLGQDFPRLIFVSDVLLGNLTVRLPRAASVDTAGIPLAATYDYFFWDASSKGLLATNAQRAQAVRAWVRACHGSEAFREQQRGVAADHLTYSRDLWTALAYGWLCSVWAPPPAPAAFIQARRRVADGGDQMGDLPREFYRTFDASKAMMTNLHQEVVQGRRLLRICAARRTARSPELEQAHALMFPPRLRERTLLLAVRYGPRCVSRLRAPEQTDYRSALTALVREAESLGFAALEVGAGYAEDDFVESCHLSESGGKKLAAEVAPAVRRLARRLGYVQEAEPVSARKEPMSSAIDSPGRRLLVPPALLLGTVVAFVGCTLAGRLAAGCNSFPGFHRFYLHTSPQTLLYPTASQVRALGREVLDHDKIAVVVGSSSVLRGFGQRQQELWTRHLQKELGDGYRVLNLAMDGGSPTEFGGTAAEILAGDFPRLIFLTAAFPCQLTGPEAGVPPGAKEAALPRETAYGYFFWDAYFKGLLPDDPARHQAIQGWLRAHPEDTRLAELARGTRLDAVTYSRDLWTTLACTRLSTMWYPQTYQSFFRPRRKYGDLESCLTVPHEQRYPPAQLDQFVEMVRGEIGFGQPAPLTRLAQSHALVFAPTLRGRTLLLLLRHSPYYEHRLGRAERAAHEAVFPTLVQGLERLGFVALGVEAGYAEDDFFDFNHLSERGGRKLAAEVAPAVRRLAQRLGYTARGGCHAARVGPRTSP